MANTFRSRGPSYTIPRTSADPRGNHYSEIDDNFYKFRRTASIGTRKFPDQREVYDEKVYEDEAFFIISFHGGFSSEQYYPCNSVFDRRNVNDNVYYITSCDDQCSVLSYQYNYHNFLKSYFSGEKGKGGTKGRRNGASRLKYLYLNKGYNEMSGLDEFSREFIDGYVGSKEYQVGNPDGDLCHLKLSRRTVENDWYFDLVSPLEGLKGLYEVRNGSPIKLLFDMYDKGDANEGEFKGERNFEDLSLYLGDDGSEYYKNSICLSEIIDKLKEEYPRKKLYIYITSCSADPSLKVSGSNPEGYVSGQYYPSYPKKRSFCHDCMKAIGFAGGKKLKKSIKKKKTKRKSKRRTKRLKAKKGGKTNKIPMTSVSNFYDFIKKYIDLPFTKKELETKTMDLKKNIKPLNKIDIDNLKNKYFPKANKLKEKLLPLLKNKKNLSLKKLDKHFTEIEDLLKDYSIDLQEKFLNKSKVRGGALRPYTGDSEQRGCPICMEDVRPNEGFIVMHRNGRSHPDPFHEDCLRNAIRSRNRCPLCREPMREDDLRLPESNVQWTMRRINEMLGNIRTPLMIIMGFILAAYMINVADNVGIPIYTLIKILACIFFIVIDLILLTISIGMAFEGDIYEAENMPLFALTRGFCLGEAEE